MVVLGGWADRPAFLPLSRVSRLRLGLRFRILVCEAGSYVRLIAFVYHSTLGLRVTKKKKNLGFGVWGLGKS